MSAVTTHVLDTAAGRPAAGVPVRLERRTERGWEELGRGATDPDGRCAALHPPETTLRPGAYRLRFAVGDHFAAAGTPAFYDRVTVEFRLEEEGGSYHVPLLLAPWGYTTYRGS